MAEEIEMKRFILTFFLGVFICLGIATGSGVAQLEGSSGGRSSVAPIGNETGRRVTEGLSYQEQNMLIGRYCFRCHNDALMTAGLSLESFDASRAGEQAEIAEKMIRKLQAGMMPPPVAQRPDAATYRALITALETTVDIAAAANPNPGGRSFQRLNRPEYERAIYDLFQLEVDAGDWLPLDTMSSNFDNIADAQTMSPMHLEAFLNAASDISRMAVGDRNAPLIDVTYSSPHYVSQHPWDHVEGAPYGTRGGMVVDHVFPADGQYVFELRFNSGANTRLQDIDISVNGEQIALLAYNTVRNGDADGRGGTPMQSEPVSLRAGQHSVSAAFIRRSDGPYEDLIRPHDWSFAGGGSGGTGITTLPHLRDLIIRGPISVTGLSDTPSRERIFICRPTGSTEEGICARKIIARVGSEAYRRDLSKDEIDALMPFYENGMEKGGFEAGIRTAVEAILASPNFVFRLERQPDNVMPGETYRLGDTDLASRLSFFLWGTPPDDELQSIAAEGKLSAPGELERQAQRMLKDPRAEALGVRFAGQWFRLQDLYKVRPDPNFYPNFDENIADAMRRETELFFNHLVAEDRSVLELYKAGYTFLNERLALHYGIPGVSGTQFRRVEYPDDKRRGVLGHGSVLVLTSFANRTSPVLRGKWVMEVLMGTPPPPPPPNVPDLEATSDNVGGRILTTRERMEIHRENPMCHSCHLFMDPIGLALDNFDVTAKWRFRENGMLLDTRGDFYDGTPVSTPGELVDVLLKRPIPLVRTFTENVLAYALGRRVEYADQPTVRVIAGAAEKDGYRMSSFILGVINSDAFQRKRVQTLPTDEVTGIGSQ
jgi:hypothetical protein